VSLSPERWRAIIRGEAHDLSAVLLRPLLWWARLPYALGVWWRNRGFDRGKNVHRVSVPVISVGNLTVGGTGKTPCVEYIAQLLRTQELQVALLSRGYGATSGHNDEALLLEENLPDVPHLQDKDRVALAHTAIEELESEVLVLDDGFQHRRLARDLDIVLIDVTDPWASCYVLPRGGLREPHKNLRRANVVLLTRCDAVSPEMLAVLHTEVGRLAPNVPLACSIHAPTELLNGVATESVEALRGRVVGAFCGIGNPEAFRRTLSDLGADVREFRTYADHHAYTRDDVEVLMKWAETLPSEAWLVTTQKDWVKLRIAQLGKRPLWAVRIGLQLTDGRAEFDQAIMRTVQVITE
jgi:tetraacyldisaccharide 4'-kinase